MLLRNHQIILHLRLIVLGQEEVFFLRGQQVHCGLADSLGVAPKTQGLVSQFIVRGDLLLEGVSRLTVLELPLILGVRDSRNLHALPEVVFVRLEGHYVGFELLGIDFRNRMQVLLQVLAVFVPQVVLHVKPLFEFPVCFFRKSRQVAFLFDADLALQLLLHLFDLFFLEVPVGSQYGEGND